jgi:hypothetical protein
MSTIEEETTKLTEKMLADIQQKHMKQQRPTPLGRRSRIFFELHGGSWKELAPAEIAELARLWVEFSDPSPGSLLHFLRSLIRKDPFPAAQHAIPGQPPVREAKEQESKGAKESKEATQAKEAKEPRTPGRKPEEATKRDVQPTPQQTPGLNLGARGKAKKKGDRQ